MKTNRIILAALFISAAVSCQKESFAGLENPRETESATIVAGEPTKTSLSGNKVHWTSDDVIAVFDNFGYKNIFNITQAEGSSASFSGEVTSGTEQIYAVYPASLVESESVSGSSIKVNVPVDQTSKVGSFDEEHNISVAKGTKTPGVETIENITFKNVCSYLKFTIPKYIEDAKSVTFSTSRAIAGPATVDASADTPVAVVGEGGSKSVTMTGSYPAGSQFMFVLTPGTIQEFTVTVVTDKATWTITRNLESEVSFAPGQYKNLGTLELEQVGVSAKATHTYSGSTLTGTTVNVALNVPTATLQYASDLKIEVRNEAGTVVRSASSSTLTSSVTLAATQDWPYLPQGEYTVSGSYKLGNVQKTFSTTFPSPAPTFAVTSYAYTSYTKYAAGSASAANSCNAETIYDVTSASVAIADAIMNNDNYSLLKGGFTYKVDNGEDTTEEKVNGLSWGHHTVTASYTFDGVKKDGSIDCHITGLPYKRSSMIESEWSFASWNCEFDNGVIKLGAVKGSGEASANSKMSFHIPATVNIKLNTNATVRAYKAGLIYCNTDFTVSVNGTQIIKQNSNKESDGKNYNLSGTTTISSGLSIKLNSSYQAAGPWSKVHSMEILYN